MILPIAPSCRHTILSAAASLAVITASASAAVKTWDGGGANDNWQTGPNWNADSAPLPDDQLVFGGTVRLTPVNDFTAGTLFNGVSFPAAAGSFNLTGNAITLTRGISAGAGTVSGGNIINSSVNPVTVALPVTLAPGKFTLSTATGAGGLNLGNTFSRGSNSSVVVSRTGGPINVIGSGLANDASGILGGWAVTGNDWVSVNGSGNLVAYTGYTAIDTGAITSGPTLNYRYTDEIGNLTAASGTTINTLVANIVANRTLTVTGTMKLGTRGGIHRLGTSSANSIMQVSGGTLTADGGGEITLWDATTSAGNFAATANNLRVDSVIANDGANPVSVNIMGYLDIRGANTYTGGTYINQGRVQTGNIAALSSGPIVVYPGGQAFLNSGGNWANAFTVSGVGPAEVNGGITGPGALRLGSNVNLTGTVTLAGATRLTSSNATATSPIISGRITGTGALELGAFATTGSILTLANAGTPNDWVGPLTISAISNQRASVVKLGASEQVPDATTVTIGGATNSTFDLNGFNETIGGLNSAAVPGTLLMTNQTGTSTLTLGTGNANGDFGGTLQDKVGSTLNLVKNGSGKQILRGNTAYFGTTAINGGSLEVIGDFNASGEIAAATGTTLSASGIVMGNVTLADGAKLTASGANGGLTSLQGGLTLGTGTHLDLNTVVLPNSPLTVAGTIAPSGGAGSVLVDLTVPPGESAPSIGIHQLISYGPGGSLGGTGISAFKLGNVPVRFAATLSNDPANKAILLNVTDSGDFPIWRGTLSSEWSTATLSAPKNWVLNSNNATTTDFLAGDKVFFNDSATNTTVDISVADVAPASVTFDNNSKSYLVTGSKGIAGNAVVTQNGSGTTVIATDNTFTGGTVINTGTLQVGSGGGGGSLGTGIIANGGILDFKRGTDLTVANVIDGPGELRVSGSATVTLSAANTFVGATNVTGGTLRVTASTSLGPVPGSGVTVNGGAIDLSGNAVTSGLNFGQKQFTISGNGPAGAGALVNTGTAGQLNVFQRVALAADASIGGTNRFDIRAAQLASVNQAVLDLGNHTLRKRGTNQISTVAVDILGSGGTLIAEQGTLSMETTTNTLGTGSIVYEAGTQGQFYQNNTIGGGISWPITVREGVAIGSANTTAATLPAPWILEGNLIVVPFNAAVQAPTLNNPLVLTGTITENGGSYSLTKNGVNTLTLTGAGSSYTGATFVNAGTLVVDSPGSLTVSPVTVAAAATLGGTGSVGGVVTGDGIISPALGAIGTFATGATTFSATGSLAVQIHSGTLTSDKLAVGGGLNLGGAMLAVTDLGAVTLPAGTKFTVASYTGALVGAFANAPDGGTLTVGTNTFKVDYDEVVLGQTSITLTSAAGSAYDDWATARGLDGTNNGKLADPDGDGLENIVEFGLDQDPLHSGNGGKARSLVSDVDPGAGVDNAFTLTVAMRSTAAFDASGAQLVSATVDGVVYRVQGGTSLADFTTLDISEVIPALSGGMPTPATGWSYRSFRLPGSPNTPNPKAFLRVDVTESP